MMPREDAKLISPSRLQARQTLGSPYTLALVTTSLVRGLFRLADRNAAKTADSQLEKFLAASVNFMISRRLPSHRFSDEL
ncbi:MAG TPA: hypothetical protein DCE44_16955 [Verrucomicrobiales bacterium]|nr:hypothetical protein [Verrucomicrobiales bacterium]